MLILLPTIKQNFLFIYLCLGLFFFLIFYKILETAFLLEVWKKQLYNDA